MSQIFIAFLFLGCVGAATITLFRFVANRSRVLDRWFADATPERDPVSDFRVKRGWLSHWLFLAGYRAPYGSVIFVVSTLICALIGFGAATLMQISGLQKAMERTVILVPGGVGETFLPVEWVAPWLIAIILVCLPWVIVRKARRKRVELVEQDLPLAMELLATLSEAGLGLETALGRILKTRLAGRPLANELRFYQCEFVGETSQLAPSGIERVAMLSQRNLLQSIPLFVEPSGNLNRDADRQRAVAQAFLQIGVPIAEDQIFIEKPPALGMDGFRAQRAVSGSLGFEIGGGQGGNAGGQGSAGTGSNGGGSAVGGGGIF